MKDSIKMLLRNNGVSLAQQVADYRLKRAGVTLDKSLGLNGRKTINRYKYPSSLIKRLAGD
jgi:hypothetical protein